jgi:gliding motility-associated-like protein
MKKHLFYFLCLCLCFTNDVKSQCEGDTTSLSVVSEVVMPSVFTPNLDNVNDGFNIFGGCIISVSKKIYNRWGDLLFLSNQINEVWNGRTSAGEDVPVGTYFYIFDVEMISNGVQTQETFKGTVSLLR